MTNKRRGKKDNIRNKRGNKYGYRADIKKLEYTTAAYTSTFENL